MSAQVQCVPKLDSTIARLMEKLHSEISVAIRVEGFGEQQKLPLEAKADAGEAYETGKAEGARRISATGRKVAAAAVKAKRKSRAKNGHASAA